MPIPVVASEFSRRGAFRLAGVAALSITALSAVVGCGSEELSGPALDSLTDQLRTARSDAANAMAAVAVVPAYAAALTVVGAQRMEHADALDTEIARATGASTESATATPTTTAPAVTTPPPDLAAVRDMLNTAARGAADAARNESGYRAGLLGSISASCTVAAQVVLA